MDKFYYFGYGSNMLTTRLRARCQSAVAISVAEAPGFSVAFCKQSGDGSGKASLVKAPHEADRALGVVFEIDGNERWALDRAEGRDYQRNDDFSVRLIGDKRKIRTTAYLALEVEAGLKPYCWYLALVIAGAREHGLEQNYIDRLSGTAFDVDGITDRHTRTEAIAALTGAGYTDYTVLLSTPLPTCT
ncbi:MAG: gamma-glutamylcyclotransferase family protein [Alphaproteobacteria bacterium]